jgi:hypothetical protein
MSRRISRMWSVAAILTGVFWEVAAAADVDPCTRFKWDVSHEVAVMRATPQALGAAVKPGAAVPLIKLNTPYALKLSDETAVTFVTRPEKSRRSAGTTAGLVRFHTDKGGRYHVSITSGHWVDVVDGGELLKALDFQAHVGCERPRKIVEYELPAARDLQLQLSGSQDAAVVLAITAVSPAVMN